MNPMSLSSYIDHTNLQPTATAAQIQELCAQAKQWGFASVCIHPSYVALAARALAGTPVQICTVIGFPLGANDARIKAEEAELAVSQGATEVDMVQAIGLAKEGNWAGVEAEIRAVRDAVPQAVLKVILECCYFTTQEKRASVEAAVRAGADFVKTSTGFGPSGACAEDVALLKEAAAGRCRVKAAGGIRTLQTAQAMIAAGADRLGASASIAIMKEAQEAYQ